MIAIKKQMLNCFSFKSTKVARWTVYFLHFIQWIICWCKSHYHFYCKSLILSSTEANAGTMNILSHSLSVIVP